MEVWSDAFLAEITVTAGDAPVNGWVVAWKPAHGQTIRRAWRALFARSGRYVVSRSLDYNSSLPPGASTSIG